MVRSRSFGRRTLFIGAAKLLMLSALGARLFYLQISQSQKYTTLSDDNRIRVRPILPVRGKLFDRFGAELATNINHYRVFFDPTETEQDEEILLELVRILDLKEARVEAMYVKLLEKTDKPLLITDSLDWDKLSQVEVKKTELPGVEVVSVPIRYYPLAESAAHVIGYLGAPTEAETERASIYKNPNYRIGKVGVEHKLEDTLRGEIGMQQEEVDARGVKVRELSIEHSTPGEALSLSLDAELQEFASEIMKDKGGKRRSGGSVVVLDIHTGEVLCMVSSPSFNPNLFSRGISTEELANLYKDSDKPILNKAINTQVPPGSTFKLFVALAALEKGVINPNTHHYCPGYFDYGDRRFHCWNDRGHGRVNLSDAIAQSCNVFFYKIAEDIGIDKISEVAKQFGFGSLTGIDLLGENEGLVPSRQWKRAALGKEWYRGETINASIGQGYMLTTPLQLTVAVGQIANGGKKITPTLLKSNGIMPPEELIAVSKYHVNLVRSGMERVVNHYLGTAFQSRIVDKNFAMAGKTGTVQVRRRVEDEKKSDIPRKFRNHAIFVGYAPIDDPKFAISVFIEHGGSGSFAAAPVARDIMYKAQTLYEKKTGLM